MTHPIHTRRRGVVHVTRAESVYPTLDTGSVSLVISDGPYGMDKAAWDRQRGPDGLREWYAPHVEAWGRVCAEAASVYLWGNQRGVRALQPLMEEHGWTWRTCVTWDKGIAYFAGRISTEAMRTFYDVTEVCDVYTREPDWPRLVRRALARFTGSRAEAARLIGVDSRLLQFWEDGERFPSWELWRRAWEVLRGPWEVYPGGPSTYEMQIRQAARCQTDKETRFDYDMLRPPFHHPHGVGNVWSAPTVAGAERLSHPCQKPLTFYDRIIRASSRPGDLVLEPFGGTLRAAVACEAMPDADARRYVCIEPDEDGRGYVPAALEDLDSRMASPGLFGGMG